MQRNINDTKFSDDHERPSGKDRFALLGDLAEGLAEGNIPLLAGSKMPRASNEEDLERAVVETLLEQAQKLVSGRSAGHASVVLEIPFELYNSESADAVHLHFTEERDGDTLGAPDGYLVQISFSFGGKACSLQADCIFEGDGQLGQYVEEEVDPDVPNTRTCRSLCFPPHEDLIDAVLNRVADWLSKFNAADRIVRNTVPGPTPPFSLNL